MLFEVFKHSSCFVTNGCCNCSLLSGRIPSLRDEQGAVSNVFILLHYEQGAVNNGFRLA